MAEIGIAQLESHLRPARCIEQLAAMIIPVGRRLIGSDGITFVVNDNGYCYYLDSDGIQPLWKGQRFPFDICISGWVMRHRQAVIIPNVFQDPRIPQDVYRRTFVKSMQMVPVGDHASAAIGSYWAEFHDPSDQESMALYALARAADTVLERLATAA